MLREECVGTRIPVCAERTVGLDLIRVGMNSVGIGHQQQRLVRGENESVGESEP
jgi:hypothetical protein